MKKSWMLILFGSLLAAGNLAMSARAQNYLVYAVEYNQSTNRFGTLDLLNGNFTKISSIGTALINDIAYCPTNGMLYGISNTTALVTFNKTNGTITKVANLSVNGIQSLAFRPSDGALFGATQNRLYTINPANGTATAIGTNYGSPKNLGTSGQNIRFAQDGNLYVSNTSTNTDMYRINTTSGVATWMGEAVGYPYLMLMNASSNMYGVFINLGSLTNSYPELATFDLSSFVVGGTNANGSTHQVTVNLVGAGTNFPAGFTFSGNVPQAVTNLTVPVSATGPSSQTTTVGSNVVFSTVASGTPPYSYAWLKNGSVLSGQTNSSLTLNNVTTADAATYSVIVGGAMGTVTNSATLTVNKATASIVLGSLNQTYDGSAKAATATTTPSGLTVTFTYNGSANAPTNAGSYTVVGTINDPNYQGSATNTLVIAQASASIVLGSLNQTYSGSPEPATATTTPSGLAVTFTYNGSATVPVNAGSYTVVGTTSDPNYQGSATDTLVIAQAPASIVLGSLNQTYSGSAEPATATTIPSGLAVTFTYNGSATIPVNAGTYTVVGTINDPNYQGSATNSLVIAQASASIVLGNLNQTYSGSAEPATATTTPNGLTVNFTYNGSATVPVNAGTYTVVGTIDDPNYQGSATNTLVIDTVTLTVTNLLVLDRVYDGTTNATLDATNAGLVGVLNSDDVTLVSSNAVAFFADKNVGTNKPVTMTGLTLSGAAAANYTLADLTNMTANVSVAELTVVGVTAASKVYDGTTDAQLNGTATLNGEVSGDDVSLVTDSVSAAFAGSDVGTAVPVTVSGYDLTGADAGNYTLTQPSGFAADITPAALTITAAANTKTYDGNTSASATPTVSGLEGSDTVTGLAETYDTKNGGTGKTLSVSAYTVNDGNSGNNYAVSTMASTAGVINPAALTITAAANTKTCDGNTSAAATPTVSGLQGSDTVTGLAETYDSKNAGTGKTLSVSAYTVNDGNAGGNYTVSAVASTAGVIGPAALTITATANTKTYDGTTSAAATPTASGLQGSDTVTGLAEIYDTKDAGTGKTLSVSAYTVNDGNAGGNYAVSTIASTAGVITPAALTVTADDKCKTCELPNPPLTATYTGFVNGENPGVLTSPVTLNTTATVSSGAGTYPIYANGAAAANYTINYVDGTLTVISTPQLTGTKADVNGEQQFIVSWSAAANQTYQLEYTDDLATGAWTRLDGPVVGTGSLVYVTNNVADAPYRFFRVTVQ